MDIGYIRVSTAEQNTGRQEVALSFCGRTYVEKISGKSADRPQLQKMLAEVRKGDTVWITELSRLGRSNYDLCKISKALMDKGVALHSLKENIDLTSATGVFTFQIFSAMAEFERAIIRERQAEGQALARAEAAMGRRGKAAGRPSSIEIDDEVFLAYERGEKSGEQIAKELGFANGSGFLKRYYVWKKNRDLRFEIMEKEREERKHLIKLAEEAAEYKAAREGELSAIVDSEDVIPVAIHRTVRVGDLPKEEE